MGFFSSSSDSKSSSSSDSSSSSSKSTDSSTTSTSAPTTTTTVSTRPVTRRPVSEALLNEKWDRFLSSMVVRASIGFTFGVVFSVLLFKRRSWPVWLGTGFGAGRAYEEADYGFRNGAIKGSASSKDGLRLVRS